MAESASPRRPIGHSFLEILVSDVTTALYRLEDDVPTHRRDAIRTIFAGVEGLSWIYREFIETAARDLELFDPIAELAFRERSYAVTERGVVQEQPRFVGITAMFRLIARVAETIHPEHAIDFSETGWAQLTEALRVRNRITHPKSVKDMDVSWTEVESAREAFMWLLDAVVVSMEMAKNELVRFNNDARDLLAELKQGDAAAVAAYRAALDES